MAKPFKVTLDLGGASVEFDLTEEDLLDRATRKPIYRADLDAYPGRDGFRRVAYSVVAELADKTADPTKVLKVHRDNSRIITMVPVASIRSVTLEDPEAKPTGRPFGFAEPVAEVTVPKE